MPQQTTKYFYDGDPIKGLEMSNDCEVFRRSVDAFFD